MALFNPFAKRETHPPHALNTYRVLVPLTWALVVVVGVYYSICAPTDVKHGHRIWENANKHTTPFSLDVVVTGIFWILLLLSQLSYVWHFYSKETEVVSAACNVATHFIMNNLFIFAFIMLWTRNYFNWAEVIIVIQLLNQHTAYRRHRGLPPFVHLPAVAGPYAWVLFALFWNGAVAVGSDSFAARIVANIFIWIIMIIGLGDILMRQDYMLGSSMALLSLALALKQFAVRVIALQWIFAFVIFAVFVLSSIHVSGTKYYGRDSLFRSFTHTEATDRERQPLLNEEAA